MIGPAVRRLVADLEGIDERSDYEEALLRELSPLLAAAAPFLEEIEAHEAEWLESDDPDVVIVRMAAADSAGAGVVAEMLVGGGGPRGPMGRGDIVRLYCSRRDCPNKRL